MKFLEFITYCQLKNFVVAHKEIQMAAWDVDAEHHFKLELKGRAYTATIKYATIGDQAAIMRCSLYDHGTPGGGTRIISDANLRDILDAFVPTHSPFLK